MRETKGTGAPISIRMTKLENAIAVPVRQIVHPVELAIGGAIALSGLALLIGRLLPAF
ncbi:hypothetical protein U5A82_19955 [Sphingobium sp. CR2-8]|uniref:hypothetical protein n=1 Tax=Sphingobium sp. CR2-8 TaxID=1306534 RepID=UPI002DBAF88F|nr:hypothetical protein [Sphingobium sp. CR2-8]MEC3912665.1 hypothetical protein [Sphingobium sp. CR2-8]